MFSSPTLEPVPYPPPPWNLSGQSWLGFFRADSAPILPNEYRHFLAPRYVAVSMIRYLSGTLQYDELIVGSMASHRGRVGLFVHHIWVDDLASLWGGRKIWGLNKQMAVFAWEKNTVKVSDADGLILELEVNQQDAILPPLPMPMPSFGQLDGQSLFTTGKIKARLGKAEMRIKDSSARFGFQMPSTPIFSVAGKPFSMTFVPPKILAAN
jgi:Acetoacetate decarboxylase (ADC)